MDIACRLFSEEEFLFIFLFLEAREGYAGLYHWKIGLPSWPSMVPCSMLITVMADPSSSCL